MDNMKKNIIVIILSVLFFVCCLTTWTYAQSDDVDMVCLNSKKDTILATSLRITSPEAGFAMALGDRIQVTTTKNPENALLDTVKLTCALSSMFSLTDDGWLIANPADLNANICNISATVFARTVLSRKIAYINVKCYENYTYNGNVPEYVELAGEKWATRNVGANSPADIGKFFMWGNIVGYSKEEFVPGNPLYDAGGYTVENYNNTSLGLGEGATRASSYTPGDVTYDAATVANNHHVTPTQDQWLALANDTGVTWITIDGNYRRFERQQGLEGVVIIKNGTQISDGQFIFVPLSQGYRSAYSSFASSLTSIWTCTASGTLLGNSARHVSWMPSTSSVCSDGRTLERGDDGDIMSYNTPRHLGKVIRPIYRE